MTLIELQRHVAELIEKYGEDVPLKVSSIYAGTITDFDADFNNPVQLCEDGKISSNGDTLALVCLHIYEA